jgi:outer membrane protein OmpA-like peptidoglycan-associated protein
LILRYPSANFTPFVHALVGGESAGSYYYQNQWGMVITAGGGLDYNTPLFNHHLALRLIQADYQFNHQDFNDFNMLRLSAGVVFRIGSFAPPVPVLLSVTASPATVFPGDPVTVTATASNLDPKQNVVYSFSGAGVTANGATGTVDTHSLAPGTYTVNAQVKEGKAGKEGLKPWQTADATASYTVKQFEPPTLSLAASPSTIKPGETSTITASGVSPQNRPLTYSYAATAGTISGTGATANFSSTGAPTGISTITGTVTDDKGQTATATTSVTITEPYVAPAPHTQAPQAISFAKDKARPTRVDNEAKAVLDEVALDLQKQPDTKAVVVGNSDAKEKATLAREQEAAEKHRHVKVVDLAAERAVNTKDYLVKEKGIDAARISVATGTADEQTADIYLVPSGATFATDVTGTTVVDETTIKVQPRKALGAKKHHAKKSAAETK